MKTKALSVWLLSLSLLFSSALLAEEVKVKEGAPTTYIVKQGDTPVSYTHLTLPTMLAQCRSRWSPAH